MKSTILSVLVENNYGVVARIAGLFARRGFNLNSIAGEETHEPSISRITISVTEDESLIDQVQKQVEKLIDIKQVEVLDSEKDILRELALIKVAGKDDICIRIKDFTEQYGAKIIDIDSEVLVFQVCNSKEKIDELLEELKQYGILECVRTGVIALQRGNTCMKE